jgi:hypothetical protein
MFNLFQKKCPKCSSNLVAVVKESFWDSLIRNIWNVMWPIRFFTGHAKAPKKLNVCQSCSFSWEDR